MSAVIALRDALLAVLRGDAAVAALVADRIYDRVPSGRDKPAGPYVACAAMNRTRIETGGAPAWTARARLYAASTSYERDEAWAIADAVAAALDGLNDPSLEVLRPLELPAPYVLVDAVRSTQAGDVIDPLTVRTVFVDLVTIVQ